MHPHNKKERILLRNKKGKRRAEALVTPFEKEWFGEEYVKERIEKDIPILGNTGKPCSCEICRNPRRSGWNVGKHKLTIQELKHLPQEIDDEK